MVRASRELEVLRLVARGLERVARRLVLSGRAGHWFVASILRELSLGSRAAAAWEVRGGLA